MQDGIIKRLGQWNWSQRQPHDFTTVPLPLARLVAEMRSPVVRTFGGEDPWIPRNYFTGRSKLRTDFADRQAEGLHHFS